MFQIKNLYYSIGDQDILQDLSWNIRPGERVALIGANGAGKTTLFRIMAGEISEYQGRIQRLKNLKIGYLPQEEIVLPGNTLLETVLQGVGDLLTLRNRIQDLYRQMQGDLSDREQEELMARAGQLETKFDVRGGYQIEARAKRILSGLGFSADDFPVSLKTLSGGWKMRAYLARLLLGDPDLLLLDEPTNHLDLPALEWLEQYLLDFKGSVVIVSHDRFFLDKLAEKVYELQNGGLRGYPGDYSAYRERKEEEIEQQEKKYRQQQRQIRQTEEFIARNRARKDRAAQAQSRIKQLEKTQRTRRWHPGHSLQFALEVREKSYQHVLDIKQLGFRYGTEAPWLFRDLDLDLYRGEKAALVGPNGAGKTTLVNLITGTLTPSRGRLLLGERVQPAVYSQHQIDALDLGRTVYEEVLGSADRENHGRIRELLGIFQFSEPDITKKIRVLSGGEKARVSLVKLLLSRANLLIMDEPTSHLDPDAKAALEMALRQYDGTLLLISHDRYFLDRIVGRILDLDRGQVHSYPGNYSFYREKKTAIDLPVDVAAPAPRAGSAPLPSPRTKKEIKQIQARIRQQTSTRRRDLNDRIAGVENRIHQLETEQGELEKRMLDPAIYEDRVKMAQAGRRYSRVKKELADLWIQWEENHRRMEELLQDLAEKQNRIHPGES